MHGLDGYAKELRKDRLAGAEQLASLLYQLGTARRRIKVQLYRSTGKLVGDALASLERFRKVLQPTDDLFPLRIGHGFLLSRVTSMRRATSTFCLCVALLVEALLDSTDILFDTSLLLGR